MSKNNTWGMTCLPSLRDLKVFVLAGVGYGPVNTLFCEAGAKRAKTVNEADLVVFLGGTDLNPKLYGEEPVPAVPTWDDARDLREKAVFDYCVKNDIAMFGICRGAQFLHVMNGGTLWQHVDGHAKQHLIVDIEEDIAVVTSSTHHQMMKYNDTMNLLAVTDDSVSSFVQNEEGKFDTNTDQILEVEACFYDKTKCLCIQGHPEYGPAKFTSWSFHKLQELLTCDWNIGTPEKTLKALA